MEWPSVPTQGAEESYNTLLWFKKVGEDWKIEIYICICLYFQKGTMGVALALILTIAWMSKGRVLPFFFWNPITFLASHMLKCTWDWHSPGTFCHTLLTASPEHPLYRSPCLSSHMPLFYPHVAVLCIPLTLSDCCSRAEQCKRLKQWNE